ncbi:hypothetical protein SAMN02910358_01100 [Lachnospiraceae bacterium XBB1006]|nr:hypothetical protein SAMN02910358_01100 [Lachnospiraceae bacterium XBB1006]
MNRLEELKQMQGEIGEMPKELQMPELTRRMKKKVWCHRVFVSLRSLCLALIIFVGGMTIGVNGSRTFADSVKSIPLLNKLAAAVDFSKGYEDAVRKEYVTKIGKVVKTKAGDVMLSYVMADDSMLVMFIDGSWEKEGYELVLEKLVDTDTGKDIEWSGITSILGNDKQGLEVLDPKWNQHHQHISAELSLRKIDGETSKELDTVSFTFSTGKKLEARTFTPKKEFTINGLSYRIDKVTMYPLSTEVEVTYLDDVGIDSDKDREYQTLGMDFTVKGKKESRGHICNNGLSVIGRDLGKGRECYYLESGYYMLDSDVTLSLDCVYQLPKELQEVTYDSETKTLTDANGELTDVTVKAELGSYGGEEGPWLMLRPNIKFEGAFGMPNIFQDVIMPNGDLHSLVCDVISSTSGEGYYKIKESYKDADGKIRFIRGYPESVEKPGIKIKLK